MRPGVILSAVCTFAGVAYGADNDADLLEGYACEHSNYKVHLFSHSPLVVYITDFVTPFERQHLQRITQLCRNGTFARSNVASTEGDIVSSHRTSQSTTVVPDAVTNCIHERARQFQGLSMAPEHIEPIQLVKYGIGEQYHFHTDWFPPNSSEHGTVVKGGNRVSSFFTYVAVSEDIAGGGTNFPRLRAPPGRAWCEYVDCDEPWEAGVTFRPVEGNAVFWTNLVEGGEGDDRVLHAGLPIARGEKLGMNIWTKQGASN
ncbi:Prolyl 4-hydroxylase subunit alpha-3 [Colletotrichum chlorophyti]|uniref:Prolyl 4-hydroxylase subunit alpha-3 n=1 Tax=Colletotrichum chlorophyti TaxID=708187 RepID=A0A1Q8RXQ0_9PEZI|nr:Prolyl 4-hydroxylase subunit alpha-3 [Colletotrichum chlorophyti]